MDVNFMVENIIQIKSGITVKADVVQKSERTSCLQKRLYLESCYM